MGQGDCYVYYYYYYCYYYPYPPPLPRPPPLLRATTRSECVCTLSKDFLNLISASLLLLWNGTRTMLNKPTSTNRTVYNPRTRQSSDFAQWKPRANGNHNFPTFPEHCLRTVQISSQICSKFASSTQATRTVHFLVSRATAGIPTDEKCKLPDLKQNTWEIRDIPSHQFFQATDK